MKRSFSLTLVFVFLLGLLFSAGCGKLLKPDVAVYAGPNYSMLLYARTLYAWGDNYYGQLGNGLRTEYNDDNDMVTDNDSKMPVRIMENVVMAACGAQNAFALTADGALYAWGRNASGELGDGTYESRFSPVKVMDEVAYVDTYGGTSVAIKKDGSLWLWGSEYYKGIDYWDKSNSTPVMIAQNVKKVKAGSAFIVYLNKDGELYGMGDVSDLGNGDTAVNKYTDSPVSIMSGVKDVETGSQQVYALLDDGSLKSWGANGWYYETGVKTDDFWIYTPTFVTDHVSKICEGGACIKDDGTLWVWGNLSNYYDYHNAEGRDTGGGIISDRVKYDGPTQVMENVICAVSGGFHFIAVDKDLNLYSWGTNTHGELGNGIKTVISKYLKDGMGYRGAPMMFYYISEDHEVENPEIAFNIKDLK